MVPASGVTLNETSENRFFVTFVSFLPDFLQWSHYWNHQIVETFLAKKLAGFCEKFWQRNSETEMAFGGIAVSELRQIFYFFCSENPINKFQITPSKRSRNFVKILHCVLRLKGASCKMKQEQSLVESPTKKSTCNQKQNIVMHFEFTSSWQKEIHSKKRYKTWFL